MSCIFCEIVSGVSPSHKIWEDSEHIAFLSLNPNTKGFSVVIPKRHFSSYIFSQSDEVIIRLTLAAKKVAKLLDLAFDDVGRTGMIFEGYGVDHLHAKLFPMHGTGNSSDFQQISSRMEKVFTVYEGYISSHDAARASDIELENLSKKIRSFSNVLEE